MRIGHRVAVAVLAAAAIGGTSLTTAQSAGAQPVQPSSEATVSVAAAKPGNVYRVRTRLNDSQTRKALCLDADARHKGAGADVKVINCNGSNAQKWQIGQINGWNVWINLAHPGYALAAQTLTKGSKLTLKRVSGSDRTENWNHTNICSNDSCAIISQKSPQLVLEPRVMHSGSRVYLQRYEGLVGTQSFLTTRIS